MTGLSGLAARPRTALARLGIASRAAEALGVGAGRKLRVDQIHKLGLIRAGGCQVVFRPSCIFRARLGSPTGAAIRFRNVNLALTFLIGIVAGAFVAVLTHRLTSRRDHANRRSEMRIGYLVSAYRSLAGASNRKLQGSTPDARALEQALDDIQLLGSRGQSKRLGSLQR